jgi:23S rRNA (uridine2552-2'-O)-methyltransferase
MGKRWLQERKRDYYYKKAKKENLRSRAAFKIIQLNNKYHLIKKGDSVLDLGSAPGGWLKAIKDIVGEDGTVLGVDLQPISPIQNVKFILGDITDENIIDQIKKYNSSFDVITSDCSPNVSGNWSLDHARQIYLAEKALELCNQLLSKGGNFIVKVFQGEFFKEFTDNMRKVFEKVIISKPEASRKKSSELYVVCYKCQLPRPEGRGLKEKSL